MPGWRAALRELFGIVPTLDLHGLGVKEALGETERFVREAHDAGVTRLRIIYGKGLGSPGGQGVLRDVIPRWLENEGRDWVERYERCPDASGMDGRADVWLKAARMRD
jgi:DNA-nicking Smr family endonuclease